MGFFKPIFFVYRVFIYKINDMVFRTYIDKINTIIEESELNCGINPVSELVYGLGVSRMLLHFDHSKIKHLIDDKIICNSNKARHYLKLINCGSMDFSQIHCGEISSINEGIKIRATSFDIILFLIPQEWDGGKGFDMSTTWFNQGYYGGKCAPQKQDTRKLISIDGSNWYQARNGYDWKEEGVYSVETLENEYEKFATEEGSDIIVGRQKFDIGNENINIDITCVVNKFINGELENYGLGIAFTPRYEKTKTEVENYVGFFTHKTNTFFEPYVETIYDEYICDDRSNFALDKKNKLYLYCNIGDKLENLDELPTCNVDGVEYEVKQQQKGVYYIEILISSKDYRPNTMLYDTWSNIKYNGVDLHDVELDFTVKPSHIFFNIGEQMSENIHLSPTVSGIKYNERIKRGDIRKLTFTNKVNYEKNQQSLVDDMEWRLYIKDGEMELDIIPYEHVNKTFNTNYSIVDTSMLIPERYYVDVKYKYNMEEIMHHNMLTFDIVDDLNNKYA